MFFTKADRLHGIWFHTYSLTLISALVAFPSLYHGIGRNPLANADMDLITVYQASLILAGQPLDFNPHTGYLLYLAVAGWLTVVDWIGFYQISDIHGLLNSPGFDEKLKGLISAARWFSVILACLLSALIYYGVILLSGNRMVALILVILLVLGGGGIAAQSIQIRTELISMLFVVAAGLLMMLIPRLSYVKALGVLGLCGFLIHLSLMAKVQGIVLFLFFPFIPLVFAFGERVQSGSPPSKEIIVTAISISLLACGIFSFYFMASLISASSGLYQAAIMVFVTTCALVYGHYFLSNIWHGLVGVITLAGGFSAASVLSLFVLDPWTNCGVFNFIELVQEFTAQNTKANPTASEITDPSADPPKSAKGLIKSFAPTTEIEQQQDILSVLNKSFKNFDYPFATFYLIVPVAAMALAILGKRAEAVKAGFLTVMAGLAVLVFLIARGGHLVPYYSIYIETWIIFALAIVVRETASTFDATRPIIVTLSKVLFTTYILAVIATNVKNRLLDFSSANTRPIGSVCSIRNWTPLISKNYDVFCRDIGHSNIRPKFDIPIKRITSDYRLTIQKLLPKQVHLHRAVTQCVLDLTNPKK